MTGKHDTVMEILREHRKAMLIRTIQALIIGIAIGIFIGKAL